MKVVNAENTNKMLKGYYIIQIKYMLIVHIGINKMYLNIYAILNIINEP